MHSSDVNETITAADIQEAVQRVLDSIALVPVPRFLRSDSPARRAGKSEALAQALEFSADIKGRT